ncbi:MAG: response regulator [bacterium]|nr:response regulator [bacterium]
MVDDEPVDLRVCSTIVSARGYEVLEAASCAEAERRCRAKRPHAAILDYQLGDGDALALMTRLREVDATLPIVILTAHGSIELAVEAMRQGADHLLTKPVKPEDLTVVLDRSLTEGQNRRRRRAYDTNRERYRPDPFEGKSASIRRLVKTARKVCASEGAVLLLGETGSGKGVLAHWLHNNGPRSAEPFVELNCAGLKPEFLESELFGYKKGAFTGAVDSKPGLLEIADRGTLFLDEIGDMDLTIQAKLLKVLEEQTFHRLGGVSDRRVDVRLVAATHRDLAAMVKAEEFRADLYFRIYTLRLVIPPLRRRREDIPGLVRQLLVPVSRKLSRPAPQITPQAVEALARYSWPGNVRELRHVLERAMILNEGGALDVGDFELEDAFAGGHADDPVGGRAEASPQEPAKPSGRQVSEAEAGPVQRDAAEEAWETLRRELRRQIEATVAAEGYLPDTSPPPSVVGLPRTCCSRPAPRPTEWCGKGRRSWGSRNRPSRVGCGGWRPREMSVRPAGKPYLPSLPSCCEPTTRREPISSPEPDR